ncbi:F-box protein At3g07870-like [Papaver somniferum]|uniref:F-box protein At3g07870-like n=1 Tax=Papaver somniferum TaxID=3469 RepID=UPI000E704846|nr:F-box protein At3g07870-like [Papaver somniferum]
MENLPACILGNILDRLPIETALQAKRVCKTWKMILHCKTDKIGLLLILSYHSDGEKKNELFYGDYNRGKLICRYRYDAIDGMEDEKSIMGNNYVDGMLGSCNGLVCFQRRQDHCFGQPFLVCNPLTGEIVYVRPYTNTAATSQIRGFGYCHTTNEYKIVRMYMDCYDTRKYYLDCKDPNNYTVQVYTVGGGIWRNKQSINFEKIAKKESIHISPEYAAGIYANGAIHWLHRRISYLEYEDYTTAVDYKITAFDLENENFQIIPLPHLKDVKYKHPVELLGGSNLY